MSNEITLNLSCFGGNGAVSYLSYTFKYCIYSTSDWSCALLAQGQVSVCINQFIPETLFSHHTGQDK